MTQVFGDVVSLVLNGVELIERIGCQYCPDVTEPGDVEMCVHCWQWWIDTRPITPAEAGRRAGAPMDNDECLAALDRAAYLMEMDR